MRWPLVLAAALAAVAALPAPASALDNGVRVPPLGWSSWYGFTQSGANETLLKEMADGMVSSGLHAAGYNMIWLDDGWALPRNASGVVQVDPALFPSGIGGVADYLHAKGLKFGDELKRIGWEGDEPVGVDGHTLDVVAQRNAVEEGRSTRRAEIDDIKRFAADHESGFGGVVIRRNLRTRKGQLSEKLEHQ